MASSGRSQLTGKLSVGPISESDTRPTVCAVKEGSKVVNRISNLKFRHHSARLHVQPIHSLSKNKSWYECCQQVKKTNRNIPVLHISLQFMNKLSQTESVIFIFSNVFLAYKAISCSKVCLKYNWRDRLVPQWYYQSLNRACAEHWNLSIKIKEWLFTG